MNTDLKAGFSSLLSLGYLAFMAGLASTASAQPTLNLPPGSITPLVSFSQSLSLSSHSLVTVQFSGIAPGFDIKNQVYAGWCVQPNAPLYVNGNSDVLTENNASFTLYNTYPGFGPSSGLLPSDQSPNWSQVNYILNHRTGYSVADVQQSIWFLLTGSFDVADIPGTFPSPGTNTLLAAAGANASFVPGPGQVVAVLLDGNGNTTPLNGTGSPQDLIVEVPIGGTIGDFVWRDTNKNGIQDCGELGINGVTVQLYLNSIAPANLVATAVTGPAPAGYTSNFLLACQNDGYYQFTGLAPGNYIVAIPNQAALNEMALTLPFQGSDTTLDSNGSSGPTNYTANAAVTLPTSASIDETIDFGFYGPINPSTTLTTKSVSPGATVEPNTPMTIVVTETNTGDSLITNVSVAGGGACTSFTPSSIPSLASGASADFTCTFNSGSASGTWSASATGTDAAGNSAPTTNESTSGSFTVIHPATTLTTKSVSPATTVEPNANITVIVTEKNTGDSAISNVSVAGGGSCASFLPASISSLAPGASADFTCTFSAGNSSGSWSAAASGTDAAGNPAPSANESTSGSFTVIHPATTLTTKSVSPATTVAANTMVTVVVTEQNTGDSTITNVSVAGGGSCASFTPANVATLAAGASADFTCTFNAGSTSGSWSAAASGTDAAGNPAPSANESTNGNFTVIHPATTLTTKSVSPATTVEPNATITVVVTEKNTGDSTITNVSVAGGGSCASFTPASVASLAAGASADFTCTFNAGATSGSWSAAASGTDAAGNPAPSANESTSGNFTVIHPATTLTTKSVSPASTVEPNATITVVVTEKNTGDSAISNVSVAGGGSCASFTPANVASLAAGASADFTCTFNAGNASGSWSAAASGTDSLGNPAPSTGESTSGTFTVIHPATTLTTKSVSPGTMVAANTTVTVVVTEKNTGDSAITNVSVAGGGSCASFTPANVATLAAGASADFTCTFNAGATSGSWSAAASGTDAAGNPAPSANESTSGTFTVIHPATTLTTKSVSPASTVEPNATITVVVTEKNTGDSTITNVSVAGGGSCASFTPANVASLAAGASADFTCTFNAGTASGSWSAAASGTDASGNPAPSAGESTSGTFTVIHPATTLTTKSVSPGTTVEPNTAITIVVTEKNTGDSTITNVSVAGGGSCASFTPANVASLAAGASADFTCTFNAGTASGSWSAAASATDSLGNPAPSAGESTSGTFTVIHPATTLTTKSVSPGTTVAANTTITVVVTEKNTGDSTISNVSVAGGGSCASFTPANVASLAVGASADFTCTFNAAASGSWTAAASGTDALGKPAPTANESAGGTFTVIAPPTATCVSITAVQGMTITPVTLTATGGVGGPYTFVATGLPAGLSMSSSGTISGTPLASGTFPYTVTIKDAAGNIGTLNCSVTITASMPPCSANLGPLSYNVSENGSNVAGEIAWFNSHLTKLGGTIPTSDFKIYVVNGKITFGTASLTVPNAVITFTSTVSCASTAFDTVSNTWLTTLPLSAASTEDQIFAAGLAYPIPAGFAQNVTNVSWSATVYTSASGLQVSWQYGISNWLTSKNGTSFPVLSDGAPDYNGMMIKPAHNTQSCAAGYTGGDQAGSPEFAGRMNVLTGGGSGGGGSNWTGSWSSAPPMTGFVCGNTPLGKGDTATIGFWHNKNGQALIDSFNGGPTATSLGNWLAAQFPYLYGVSSSNNLTNQPNTAIASLFLTFFNVSGQKTNAQMLGGALACYATSTTLSGTVGGQYGFNTSAAGTCSKTYNVGSNGTAIGLSNNTSYTVLQLLQQANLDLKNGTFNANAFNSIFDGINQLGDIN